MSDRTATSALGAQRAQTSCRGGPSGHVVVGDYVGQPAGEAAQAVRRAGLCPGLDRSFGCPGDLVGLVVAQDPPADSDMARNGMVTLYVAAPGGEPVDGDAAADAVSGSVVEPVQSQSSEAEPSGRPTVPRPVRRRKPGLARRPTPTFDPPLPPSVAGVAPDAVPREVPETGSFVESAVQAPGGWPTEFGAEQDTLEDGFDEGPRESAFSQDDFVVHVEDVLAGRSGPPAWHRAYPHRRAMRGLGNGLAVRAWISEHRKLAVAIGVALALWVVLGVAPALYEHRADAPSVSTVVPGWARGVKRRRAPAPERARVENSNAGKPPSGPARSYGSRQRSSWATPSRSGLRRVSRAVRQAAPVVRAPAVTAVSTPAPALSQAAVSSASTPPSAAPEQSGGGLFSP